MNVYTTMESPVGELLLIGRPSSGGVALTSVTMARQRYAPEVRDYDTGLPTQGVKVEHQGKAR